MSRHEMTFKRDMSFHVARRRFGYNIPATDIDFLEYDRLEPVLLWEAKSNRSSWRNGNRTASMVVQWKLANMAGIPYAVVEHNDEWSEITVCKIDDWKDKKPIIADEQKMTLKQFVSWLYEIRNRRVPLVLSNIVPDELKQIAFEGTR